MVENFTNKKAFLATLGLVCVNDKKEDQLVNSSKKSNKKKRTIKFPPKFFFTIPITIVARNSFLFEKFYKYFKTSIDNPETLNYEKYCSTSNFFLEKNEISKKPRIFSSDLVNTDENKLKSK